MSAPSATKRAQARQTPVSRKSFHFKGHRPKQNKPQEIDLDGTIFHMRKGMSGLLMLDFAAASAEFGDLDDPDAEPSAEQVAKVAGSIRKVLELAIVPEEWPAFEQYCHDPENEIDLEALTDIAGHVIEQYSERPTEKP